MDGEKECARRVNFGEIVPRANYLKCGETFPTFWTKKEDLLEAMNQLMIDAQVKREYVITTMGAKGAILLKRGQEPANARAIATWKELASIITPLDDDRIHYFVYKPSFQVEETVIVYCPAYKAVIIADPTGIEVLGDMFRYIGAGDVHFGSIGYSLLENHSVEKTLRLAAFVASMKCRFSGLTGIPNAQEIDRNWVDKI
jgi:sugar/nucleoside kinase (ribokinase family)